MNQIGKAFLVGLVTVLPLTLTLYLVYFLGAGAERLMRGLIQPLLSDYYWTGLGLVTALVVVTGIGFLMKLPGLSLLVRFNDAVMDRIPVIKTIYATMQDIMDFISKTKDGESLRQPVMVTLAGDLRLVGLVTDPDIGDDRSFVYLPMSYQLGGYMISVRNEQLEKLDMTVNEAMRLVVTAGIQGKDRKQQSGGPSARDVTHDHHDDRSR